MWSYRLWLVVALSSLCDQATPSTIFDPSTIPFRAPPYCNKMAPMDSVCRGSFARYTYNPDTNECQFFYYGGCGQPRNMYMRRADCERDCKRSPVERRALQSSTQGCQFQANLGRECSTTSGSIGLCLNRNPANFTQNECTTIGCCWDPTIRICYQKNNRFINTQCQVRYADELGFYGKLSFQSDRRYLSGWTGQLSFTTSVGGAFCILRDGVEPRAITISSVTMNDRKFFFLQGPSIYEGQNIVVLFAGSYGASNFSRVKCSQLNLP